MDGSPPGRDHPVVCLLVLLPALLVAVVSARSCAGSWSDGSRLATVECLVDEHTLAIDHSLFVEVPQGPGSAPAPYTPGIPCLRQGTGDRVYIGGHFYSHKGPVPALLLAGLYQGSQWTTGLTARARPDRFCYALTLGSSGLAYVAAVWCLFRLGRPLRLALPWRLALTAGVALTTVAAAYAEQVNDHILLLAVAAWVFLELAWLARCPRGASVGWRLLKLGSLAGLGYTLDLAAGPALLLCVLGVVAWRCRRPGPVLAFLAAALPWLALHHAVNYAIGGTWGPLAAVPDYFRWPGSSFSADNLTGGWKHAGLLPFLDYAGALLLGDNGFLRAHAPLLLTVPALGLLLRGRPSDRPEVLCAVGWFALTWLVYAAGSNNFAGGCCSVRWFVPLLASGYYLLALLLAEYPRYRVTFVALSGAALLGAVSAWWHGPWLPCKGACLGPLLVAAVLVRLKWEKAPPSLIDSGTVPWPLGIPNGILNR